MNQTTSSTIDPPLKSESSPILALYNPYKTQLPGGSALEDADQKVTADVSTNDFNFLFRLVLTKRGAQDHVFSLLVKKIVTICKANPDLVKPLAQSNEQFIVNLINHLDTFGVASDGPQPSGKQPVGRYKRGASRAAKAD